MTAGLLRPAPPPDVVLARAEALRARIEATGRDPATVTVVAVTKGFEPTAAEAALAAGFTHLGENYAAELLAKAAAVGTGDGSAGPVWHYLGALQRRKVPTLAPVVGCWETLSRLVEAEAVAAHAPGAVVFVQLNTSLDPGRNGCPVEAAGPLVAAARALGLVVRGVMTVAPRGGPAEARAAFATAAAVADELGLVERSMGMSDDLEPALEAGATVVRVGRALFGERSG